MMVEVCWCSSFLLSFMGSRDKPKSKTGLQTTRPRPTDPLLPVRFYRLKQSPKANFQIRFFYFIFFPFLYFLFLSLSQVQLLLPICLFIVYGYSLEHGNPNNDHMSKMNNSSFKQLSTANSSSERGGNWMEDSYLIYDRILTRILGTLWKRRQKEKEFEDGKSAVKCCLLDMTAHS